ncbi:MAG: MFS transporter [Spirochaetales bacterium]|nr:MFS transporter [Spirochaetales bacterium]
MKKKVGNSEQFPRDLQYFKFSAYGFLKNLRFFEPFLILFFLEKGISFLEIGTLYAIREIAVNVLEIPTGAVADALGRRRTMIASFVSYLISFAFFWQSSSMLVFIGAMMLFSFGDAFRTGTHKAMIFTYLKITGNEQFKTDYYGHTRGWSQTGSAVSSVIAAGIVFISGNYTAIFLFSTIPYFLDLLLMISYPKELDGTRSSFSFKNLVDAFLAIWESLVLTVRKPGALKVVISAGAYGGFFKGTKDFLQPLIVALALVVPLASEMASQRREAILVGLVYMVIYLMTAYSSRRAGRLAKTFRSPERAMNWMLLLGLSVGIFIGFTRLLDWTIVPVILFMVIYLVQNMRRPIGVSVVSDRVPDDILATVLSVESQVQSLIAAIVVLVIGAAADTAAGNVGVGILVASAVGLAALPVLWIRPQK